MTRAQRALLPLSADVAQVLAEQHGVCVRPIATRRIDTTTTGRIDIIPVPCGSIRDDHCRPCADKARRLRMVQCRQGWHLDTEPIIERATPIPAQQELMAARADLFAADAQCKANRDDVSCEQIVDSVADLDAKLRASGIRGRLTPLDPPAESIKRSTRRRQDAPDLPRRRVERRTVGQVFAGRYRPSTFLTLTLDSYGRVDNDGAAIDPDQYDYRRAVRDAIHFPALLDRFWQNTRRCVGWEVQYFGTVEPQKRGAPHFHAALRGTTLSLNRWIATLLDVRNRAQTVQALLDSQGGSLADAHLEQARRRLTNAEAKLRRHQAAIEAGIDPAALVDAINQAQPNAWPPELSWTNDQPHRNSHSKTSRQ
jgi:hypothetical protein